MINVISPRIHNLGDFANCLPALSGLYNHTGHQISLVICDRLKRFNGIKDLLLYQEMIYDVNFMSDRSLPENFIIIDDIVEDTDEISNPLIAYRFANFINKYGLNINVDNDFELHVPYFYQIEHFSDKILVGDRWAPSDAPDVDDRRKSNILKNSGIFEGDNNIFLDYTDNLVYNCSMIKYNHNPFYTTFTGIAVLSDLMNKETIVLWDDEIKNWQGDDIETVFERHFDRNRKSTLKNINEYEQSL